MNNIGEIDGLRIEENLNLGSDANGNFMDFATVRPVNIVFHGHLESFKYQYYGIHRGTEDRLTFVGSKEKEITAHFIDCRSGSESWGYRCMLRFNPSLSRVLIIPAGIAHTFEGLEDVYTVNSAVNYLPEPNGWFAGNVDWNLSADTINLPRDIDDADIPRIENFILEASDIFYKIASQNIEDKLGGESEYPLTQRIQFHDGTNKLIKFRKRSKSASNLPVEQEICGAFGTLWKRRIYVTGGEESSSGFTTITGPSKFRIYSDCDGDCDLAADMYGRRGVTFFGHPHDRFDLELCDNKNRFSLLDVEPSPYRRLLIPKDVNLRVTKRCNLICLVEKFN